MLHVSVAWDGFGECVGGVFVCVDVVNQSEAFSDFMSEEVALYVYMFHASFVGYALVDCIRCFIITPDHVWVCWSFAENS